MKRETLKTIWQMGWKITLGSAIFALGFDLFREPNNLNVGGMSGLAMVLRELLGFGQIGRLIREMAIMKIERCPVLLGSGVVENAYEHPHTLFVAGPEEIMARDAEALLLARSLMPSLPCAQLDLLLVDRIGKEFSGGGMDGNITGRYSTPYISGGPEITKIVVFDVTEASHGNANGVGLADVIT